MRRFFAWILLCAAPTAVAQTFTGSMSGAWWNPARPGEGQVITFETVGTRQVAFFSYFTYTPQGTATWLVGNADYQPGAASVEIPLATGSGARFGRAFRTADVVISPAGSVTLEYVSCGQMRMRYSGAQSFTLDLVRLIGPINGVACPKAALPPRTAANTFVGTMSGSWWSPSRSGEGQVVSFETVNGRNVVFFTYFTYDANGAASWLVGNTDYRAEAASISIPLYRASGARFGNAFRGSDVALTPAGHAVLDYRSCSQMDLRYAGTESYTVNLTRLVGPLAEADCPSLPPQLASISDTELRSNGFFSPSQTGNAARSRVVPSIGDPLPQLGKVLFFSKALSGNLDTACASCHHPKLAGGDGLSLPVGAGALQPHVLGPGRRKAGGGFSVGRNSPTYFNVALFDRGLFWDSRIESVGGLLFDNGAQAPIRTPDTALNTGDPRARSSLPTALARFPIPNQLEMRGGAYPGLDDEQYRARIAARLGNYGSGAGELAPSRWLERFRAAFGSQGSAQELVTFDNIALALGEYMRSAVFVDNPWSRYVRGDNSAVSEQVKRGALKFLKPIPEGANCTRCHVGDFFTSEAHRNVAYPQIGSGSGDGINGTDDLGRMRETRSETDRYRFRVPSLLNVELTAPYGHAGAFGDLGAVISHYLAPEFSIGDFVARFSWCQLPQFIALADCAAAAGDVARNSLASLAQVAIARVTEPTQAMPVITGFGQDEMDALIAFLKALTDPCLRDRACYGRWIPSPDEAPDGHQLDGVDSSGRPL